MQATRVRLQVSDLASRADGYVEIDCSDPSKFKSWSAAGLSRATARLRAADAQLTRGEMTQTRYNEIEQMAGLNYNPNGLVFDQDLRACFTLPEVVTCDWVHTLLADGVLMYEVRALLQASDPFGANRASVYEFLVNLALCVSFFCEVQVPTVVPCL